MNEKQVKKEFVKQSLEEIGSSIRKAQLRAILKYVYFHSPSGLHKSKQEHNFKVTTEGNFDGKLTITHPIYERFLDMKVLRSPSGKIKKRKPKPIHNRIIFGHLDYLTNKLAYGLTETVIQDIKQKFQSQ